MVTEQEVVEKIDAILRSGKFPSFHDVLAIKKELIEIMKAIDHFEIVERNDDDTGLQSARELIAQARIAIAVEKFRNSNVIKKLS